VEKVFKSSTFLLREFELGSVSRLGLTHTHTHTHTHRERGRGGSLGDR